MYRTCCGDRLLQRCDLYHAGAYSGVQIEHSNTYDVYMEFENEDKMSMVIKKLREEDILISNVVIIKKRSKTQSVVIQATMEAAKWKARHTVFREVRQQEGVISVEEI